MPTDGAGGAQGLREDGMATITHFLKDDSGATAFEYGLIAAAAGLAVSAILPILKTI